MQVHDFSTKRFSVARRDTHEKSVHAHMDTKNKLISIFLSWFRGYKLKYSHTLFFLDYCIIIEKKIHDLCNRFIKLTYKQLTAFAL